MDNNNQNKEFIKLTNDLLFKETFANVKPHILEDFLETMLDYEKGTLHNKLTVTYEKTLPKNSLQDKDFRCDVIIKYDSTVINLECYTTWDINSEEKSIYYVMRILSAQKNKDNGNEIEKVIQINVAEKNKTGRSKLPENLYQIVNTNNFKDIMLKDNFLVKVFSLDSTIGSTYNMSKRKVKWLKFIGAKTEKERKKYAKGDKILMELTEWLDNYVMDRETRRYFRKWDNEIRTKHRIEELTEEAETKGMAKGIAKGMSEGMVKGMSEGMAKGMVKGMKKGVAQGKLEGAKANSIEIAKNLLALGVNTIKQIAKATGLSQKEIKKLKNN